MAEVMPVISEKNQQECVGGHYYVGGTGDYLADSTNAGFYGTSDYIFIITGVDMSGFQTAVNNSTLNSYNGGKELYYEYDDQKKCDVYQGIGSNICYPIFDVYSHNCLITDDSSKPAIYIDGENNLVFNEYHDLMRKSTLEGAWGNFVSGLEIP